MFACTLFVLVRKNSPSFRIRYSDGYGRIDRVCVYGICADTDGYTVFASTLFVLVRKNSQC